MAVPGTGSTNQSLTFAASKKVAGKAHTSNLKELYNETIPSNIQINTSTIFAETIPTTVTSDTGSLYSRFSASLGATPTVEYVDFYVESISGTTYDANVGNFGDVGFGGGDEAQPAGPHGYQLRLTSSYQAQSSNPNKGSGFLLNNQIVHQSNGALQLVNPLFGPQTGNNYGLQLFTGHPDDGGLQIPTTSPIEFLVDYFNGVVFVQDYKASAVPKYARGYIYTGKFADTAISEAAGGGFDSISGSLATYHRVSGSTGTFNLIDTNRVSAEQVTAKTLSGSLLKLSDGSDYLIAGTDIGLSTGSNGSITIGFTGSGGIADVDTISGSFATYNAISGAAGDFYTIDADKISAGSVTANKFSGSLTTLSDGTDYLLAGSGITLSTGSSGAVTIAASSSVVTVHKYLANNSFQESPDGSRTTFTVALSFVQGTQMVFRSGLYMTPGASNDYTVTNSTTIEFAEPPQNGENLRITFIRS